MWNIPVCQRAMLNGATHRGDFFFFFQQRPINNFIGGFERKPPRTNVKFSPLLHTENLLHNVVSITRRVKSLESKWLVKGGGGEWSLQPRDLQMDECARLAAGARSG